jgi:hypothetical protein
MTWNGTFLSFTAALGAGGNGLQAMVPTKVPVGDLTMPTVNGNAVAFARPTMRGRGVRSTPSGLANSSGDIHAVRREEPSVDRI